jgi:hypothetical protein
MFSQVIDLLVRKRKQRTRILLLALRVLFSIVLTCKLATGIGYDVGSWVWASPEEALKRVFDGSYVLAFALFFIVWKLSFGLVHSVLTWYGIFVAERLYRLLARAIRREPGLVGKVWYEPVLSVIIWMFNLVDVVVIEPSGVRPGTQFYRFYDYLKDVDKGKRETDVYQASLTISLTIQFLLIYSAANIEVVLPWYLKLAAFAILADLFLANLMSFALDMLISLKHGRLLDLLAPIDPNYGRKRMKQPVVEDQPELVAM